MATPERLWYTKWSPSPAKARIPPMSLRSHMELIGSVPKHHHAPGYATATPSPMTTPPRASFMREPVSASATMRASGRGPTAECTARSTNPQAIERRHDSKLGTTWCVAGESFLSRYDAEKYLEKTDLAVEEARTSLRRSQRSRRSSLERVEGHHGTQAAIPIVLGRPGPHAGGHGTRGSTHALPGQHSETASFDGVVRSPTLSLTGSIHETKRTQADESAVDMPKVTRIKYASILDHPESSFSRLMSSPRAAVRADV